MKFAFYTLGCKTNQYETQAMERLLTDLGHSIGSFDEICDAYVINTCSVTAVADKKNRAVIRRCRRDHPDAVIGVCGCYSQHDSEAVRSLGIDVVGGSARRQEFLDMMELYGVRRVYCGHIHGLYNVARTQHLGSLEITLISSDFLDFIPYIIK